MKQIPYKSAVRCSNVLWILFGTGAILLVSLVAMQFTQEVQWGLADFVIIGGLLIGTGLLYEFVATKLLTIRQRLALGALLLTALLLIWAELAVGIIGTPHAGN